MRSPEATHEKRIAPVAPHNNTAIQENAEIEHTFLPIKNADSFIAEY